MNHCPIDELTGNCFVCLNDLLAMTARAGRESLRSNLCCILWLLKESYAKNISDARIKAEKKFGIREDQLILCRNCHNIITSPDYIITVDDRHRHTFVNPAGITYQIGCFAAADGCIVHGEPTIDHTWFTGFSWNYALCANCLMHLGWHYQSENEGFFGLILDLIVDVTTH